MRISIIESCIAEVEGKVKNMIGKIDESTIEYVEILSQLELSVEEKQEAMEDMEQMLLYFDRMNELDTSDVEPMTHIFPISNVFRKDEISQELDEKRIQEETLRNAPHQRDGMFVVPQTFSK